VERVRWLLTFVLIVFVAVLGAMGSVHANAAGPTEPAVGTSAAPHPPGFDEGEEDEWEWDWDEGEAEASQDEGEAADECEFEDEAREEACEEALEEKEAEEAEAEECRLDSAEATVAAVPSRNKVRLTIRYKTFEPSAVSIDLGLRGGKGSLDLGSDTAQFGRSGTLHTTETLTDPQMERAMAAKEFTVGVYALNTPDFCRASFERHLTARKGAGAGLQWSDPGAARRAKAARAKS
jgi:hypothetical protein